MSRAIIEELIHLSVSLAIGLAVGAIAHQYRTIYWALAAGFLVDIDHLVDYWATKGRLVFNLREFLGVQYFHESRRVFVLLHAYEWAIMFLLAGVIWSHWACVFVTLALSLATHLVIDKSYHCHSWLAYSLIYRLGKSFRLSRLEFKE